jgi:hypothetical protein
LAAAAGRAAATPEGLTVEFEQVEEKRLAAAAGRAAAASEGLTEEFEQVEGVQHGLPDGAAAVERVEPAIPGNGEGVSPAEAVCRPAELLSQGQFQPAGR